MEPARAHSGPVQPWTRSRCAGDGSAAHHARRSLAVLPTTPTTTPTRATEYTQRRTCERTKLARNRHRRTRMNVHEQAGEGMLPPGFLLVVSAQGELSTRGSDEPRWCAEASGASVCDVRLAHCSRVCYREDVTRFGGGGEMADAADLKSASGIPECGFESRPPHHTTTEIFDPHSALGVRASGTSRPPDANLTPILTPTRAFGGM
jgi:hypothetical protein